MRVKQPNVVPQGYSVDASLLGMIILRFSVFGSLKVEGAIMVVRASRVMAVTVS